ncbi:hypothetical protein [Halopiger goleimassiliensis]|uniref:hypothetical protein n=1 Tax=Halopiger goleimassiliensis TaxID=1293048 RepID=UPI000677E54D|nr:hypothetical protein [Halopiger goleimassiliensis]
MGDNVTLERVEEVPPESRVCHYDELAEPAKERLPTLMDDAETSVDGAVVDGFHDCDLVKYTEYYAVSTQ